MCHQYPFCSDRNCSYGCELVYFLVSPFIGISFGFSQGYDNEQEQDVKLKKLKSPESQLSNYILKNLTRV